MPLTCKGSSQQKIINMLIYYVFSKISVVFLLIGKTPEEQLLPFFCHLSTFFVDSLRVFGDLLHEGNGHGSLPIGRKRSCGTRGDSALQPLAPGREDSQNIPRAGAFRNLPQDTSVRRCPTPDPVDFPAADPLAVRGTRAASFGVSARMTPCPLFLFLDLSFYSPYCDRRISCPRRRFRRKPAGWGGGGKKPRGLSWSCRRICMYSTRPAVSAWVDAAKQGTPNSYADTFIAGTSPRQEAVDHCAPGGPRPLP